VFMFFSLTPCASRSSKYFAAVEDFPLNNHKMYAAPSFFHGQQRPVRPPVLSSSGSDHSFSAISVQRCLHVSPARPGGGCMGFSPNGLAALSLVTSPFLFWRFRVRFALIDRVSLAPSPPPHSHSPPPPPPPRPSPRSYR